MLRWSARDSHADPIVPKVNAESEDFNPRGAQREKLLSNKAAERSKEVAVQLVGCQIQSRLIAGEDPWYRMFCMFLPVATDLLNLRHLEGLPVHEVQVLSSTQTKILTLLAKKRGVQIHKVGDLKLEIARLGGHIKYTGPPGWRVLARGLEELRYMEIGWELHRDK